MANIKRNFAPLPLYVLQADCSPQEKLFVLAVHHHDWDGEKAWPSFARLALITGFKDRTLRQAAKDLEARGWLKIVPFKGGSNYYEFDLPHMTLDECNAAIKARMNPGAKRRTKDLDPGATCRTTAAPDADPPRRHVPPNESNKREPGNQSRQTSADAPYLASFGIRWTAKTGATKWLPDRGYKQELKRLRENGVLPAEFDDMCFAYFALDDPYLAERGWPLVGLTSWRWNQLKLKRDKGDDPRPGPTPPKLVL